MFVALALLGMGASKPGLSDPELDVVVEGGGYYLDLAMVLDAPISHVYAILTDFEQLHLLEESIIESRRLDEPTVGSMNIFTRLRGCLVVFCRDIERVESVVVRPESEIIAVAISDRSNADSYQHTLLYPDGDRTRVRYVMGIEPHFWVPPFIGRRAMARQVRKATLNMFINVERLARERGGTSR